MKNFAILALSAIAIAAPLEKRDTVFETVVEEVYETVYSTTTVWVDPTPAPSSASVAAFYEQHKSLSSLSSVIPFSAAPVAAVYAPSAAPAVPSIVPIVSSAAPYVPPPAPTTSAAPAPAAAAPTAVAPSLSTYVAPANPAPSAAAPASAAPASASGSSGGQGDHTGDITYYDVSVGTGSCGTTASNSDLVVALSHLDMNNGANPNNNPLCGTMINIYYNGGVHSARVFDTCPVCAAGSLDLTEALFNAVAPGGDGRVHGVSWSFA
jgi:hypothetical protein